MARPAQNAGRAQYLANRLNAGSQLQCGLTRPRPCHQEIHMTQQPHDQYDPEEQNGDLSRRDFVAMGLAAGVVAAGLPASAAMPVVETMVEIKTPDGTCDAAFSHP